MAEDLKKEICREIAKDFGMPYEQVVSIENSATSYIKHVMEHSGFETIKLPYFGKFTVNPIRLKEYNEGRIKNRMKQNGLIHTE